VSKITDVKLTQNEINYICPPYLMICANISIKNAKIQLNIQSKCILPMFS